MNYKGSRYNADVHNALEIMNKFEKSQTVDEAPYSMMNRVKDATKGIVPGSMNRMAKGRVASGRLANDLNKQYQSFLLEAIKIKKHKQFKTLQISLLNFQLIHQHISQKRALPQANQQQF